MQFSTRVQLLLIAAMLLGASGCCPGYVRVIMQAGPDTNQGRPIRVLVRNVDEITHRGESYAAVSALVVKPDATVLRSLLINPRAGYKKAFWVKIPKEKPVGFYFFYTQPAASWKMWLAPLLPWRITVPLGPANIDVDGVREWRILRNR